MKTSDYVTKLDTMTDDGIIKGTDLETTDSMLKDYSDFRTFYIEIFIIINAIKI